MWSLTSREERGGGRKVRSSVGVTFVAGRDGKDGVAIGNELSGLDRTAIERERLGETECAGRWKKATVAKWLLERVTALRLRGGSLVLSRTGFSGPHRIRLFRLV